MTTKTDIRQGTYYDSIVLMQLQAGLAKLPGIQNVGVVMGTEANKAVLAQTDLLTDAAKSTSADDLIIAVTGADDTTVTDALAQVDNLLAHRRSVITTQDYLPQSVEAATKMLPDANWVAISVPGRYAAGVARESLRLGKNVFLYSDNVSLEDEIALKQSAQSQNLLVMGPDCGTAMINGVGFGFANRVRRGRIGVIAASGTGLQQVTARIHQLGAGITHALGTGGRDLSAQVGAITAKQALSLLAADPETAIIVLISKPPATEVADELLALARRSGKSVVVNFIGLSATRHHRPNDSLCPHFGRNSRHCGRTQPINWGQDSAEPTSETGKYLRGLYSGGTLAYEAMRLLQDYIGGVSSNAPLDKRFQLADPLVSQGHTIVDLGEDEFTVGRLHPMMDHSLRIQRLQTEAQDPEVAIILLDVVLCDGAHPDPASELAPAIKQALQTNPTLKIVAVVVGTDDDPQDMPAQIEQLTAAGARVSSHHETAIRQIGQRLRELAQQDTAGLSAIHTPPAIINVGLETFTTSFAAQEAPVVHVNWKPPAGGNTKLMSILERMKQRK